MHNILSVVQDCKPEIAIFWTGKQGSGGKVEWAVEDPMYWKGWKSPSAPENKLVPQQQRGAIKGSEPHRNDRFSWKRAHVHKGAEWEGWEKDAFGASHRNSQNKGRGGLTLEQLPRSSLADRWSWTAVLKRWLSRRKNSSGSYIPAKGVVRNTGALKVSIMARLVLFCLTGVMLATYSHC